MKTTHIIFSAAVLITLAACSKPAEVAGQATINPSPTPIESVGASHGIQSAPSENKQSVEVPEKNEVPATTKPSDTVKPLEEKVKTAVSQPVAKTVNVEQDLNSVIPNRQATASARTLEQKQRGNKAEEEMMMELGSRK